MAAKMHQPTGFVASHVTKAFILAHIEAVSNSKEMVAVLLAPDRPKEEIIASAFVPVTPFV